MKRLVLTVLAALSLTLAGCYTVPETGRKALILPGGNEEAEGAAAFADMKSKEKLSDNPIYNEQVQRVGARIAAAVGSDLPGAKWEFVVFDEPKTVNAFALPGGKVGVYSGLIKLVGSDDEIAIVMGHEIAHVTARHGAQRRSEGILAVVGAVALGVATNDSSNQNAILLGYGALAGGATLAFSRSHESEADHIGLRYAAKAGYDPHAAITFWKKMAAESKGSNVPTLLRTHPTDEKRIADLEHWLPEAIPMYEAAKSRYAQPVIGEPTHP
ncbi:MAG TPA: M48 family metallopeptidase [Candidatus Didemnitutus sp.]|nr:M48 family metallopeptidase [Candidatus Didemnitutus sp.]